MTENTPTIEELQQAVAEADAAAEMKSNFLATISHEIRTPMQTIYGLLELIADEKPSEAIAAMTETAQGAASGLLEILDDILDLAKMDADKMELDIFEVPVRLLVRGTLEALAVKVHGLKVELKDDITEDVPFVVIGDPKRLRQIIMNLTGNALKFTEKGTVTVRVTTNVQHIQPPEGKVGLRFEIIDTGIGMSEEICQKLFGTFTQADSSTQRKYGGTGLGLSISKKLVHLMDGKIGVESKEGVGSTFWFEIPSEEVSTEATTIDLPNLDGISIISVEDHPQGAKEIVRSLRSMGAKIESCATYQEGLNLIQRQPFDVAIIDQGLPDGLGLDLIKDVMQTRPNMGMIMYTVRDDVGLSHSLQALGVTYLTKPASRAGLGEAVRDAASKVAHVTMDGPRKLLLAEDTEGVREVLSRQLDKIGVDYDFVHDGKQALEALETGEYGLLITDLHMPNIDGYGVVENIRARDEAAGTHFPVIVLTADVQMAQRDTYMRHGFDECLLKPVSLGQFKRLLIRWGLYEQGETTAAAPAQVNETKTQSAPSAIDKNAVIDQMGAFGQGEIDMLKLFPDMARPLVEQIQTAQSADDPHALAEAAHSLKGAALSTCAMHLGDIAGTLQNDAEAGKSDSQTVEALLEEFKRVEMEIEGL